METNASVVGSPTIPTALEREVSGSGRARPSRLGELGVRAIVRSDRLDGLALPLQRRLRRLSSLPVGRRAKDFLNGTWLGHPLHPALTDIPIGAWTTTLVVDALAVGRWKKLDRAAEAAVSVGIAGAT